MGEARVKEEALRILGLFQVLPRLVVFDLDYTLWPFYWYDMPSNSIAFSIPRYACYLEIPNECRSRREMPSLYPQAKGILYALKDKGIDLAIASRSPTSDIAKTFLNKLEMQSMFVAQEVFSSWTHKTEHFQRIHRRTGVPFKSMLFFDDEDRNIKAMATTMEETVQKFPVQIACNCGPKLLLNSKAMPDLLPGATLDAPNIMHDAIQGFSWALEEPLSNSNSFTDTVSEMGATCILVDNGVNLEALRLGLTNFARKSTAPVSLEMSHRAVNTPYEDSRHPLKKSYIPAKKATITGDN
ncbi:hypothetical protein ACLOJK_038793 [Asimina triloba]